MPTTSNVSKLAAVLLLVLFAQPSKADDDIDKWFGGFVERVQDYRETARENATNSLEHVRERVVAFRTLMQENVNGLLDIFDRQQREKTKPRYRYEPSGGGGSGSGSGRVAQ